MPARELVGSVDAPNATNVGTLLLKRHKTLPHPRDDRSSDLFPAPLSVKSRDTTSDAGASSIQSSDNSSPHTLKHASRRIGAPGLPPTPPTHSRQSSGSHSRPSTAAKPDVTSITPANVPSVPSTPPNQRSPPTPDVTPPRTMPLSFRPRASERYPSSRTDSFKTARENPYSSDEDEAATVRPALASERNSFVQVPPVTKKAQYKDVGLGLSLDLEDNEGSVTPRPRVDRGEDEFVVFDGEWGGSTSGSTEEVSEVERVWDDNLMRNVVVRKGPIRRLPRLQTRPVQEVVEDHIISPTLATKVVRNLPLQERIARHRMARDLSDRITKEKAAERGWLSTSAESESPTTSDAKRFSTMSGRSMASTVVEAMVLDITPTRRKTLRHSRKQMGLRSIGSDQSTIYSTSRSTTSTAPNSVASSNTQRRLHHSVAKLPERQHQGQVQIHQSAVSTRTVSTPPSSVRSRREVLKSGAIPVVVIPDRRSSSKSSRAPSLRSTSSRRTGRSNSLNSAPLSLSSKFNDPGHFDAPPTRKRTMSESEGSSHSVRTIDYPPIVPLRRSSLSAPTSRNASRAGSLTAESLKAHNMLQINQETPKPEPSQSQQSPELDRHAASHSANSGRLNVDHNDDPFFGRRLSTQATPLSQASYETAGTTAEVSEAMAVSIYPHQNRSVLVVQHKLPSEPSPPLLPIIDTLRNSLPKMSINGASHTGTVTPPRMPLSMDEVDSPLRNPRIPPEPPAIKFIPPTPAGNEDEERQLGYKPVEQQVEPKKSGSIMRRAFSSRRPAELTGQHPGFLKRTFSLSSHRKELMDERSQSSRGQINQSPLYPSVTDEPADNSKLHPFWRPGQFWDDLEGEDEYYDEDDEDSRPRFPKRTLSERLKRTFAILPIQDDHDYDNYAVERRTMRRTPSGNMRVVKQRSNSSLRRGPSERRLYSDTRPLSGPPEGSFGYGFKDGNGGKLHTIPGLGVKVEYVGWSAMKRRMSEKRREQRSQKLRATISGPTKVKSGLDDVLRSRRL